MLVRDRGAMVTTVLIVDDHAVVRGGLRTLLVEDPTLELVAEASTAAAAREALRRHQPDVAVFDVVLPDGDGIQLCREVERLSPSTRCLLLTSFPERRAQLSAAIAGAAGYLSKDVGTGEILRAIHAAAAGEQLLDEDGLQDVLDELAHEDEHHERLARLTPQEQRVFELIGQGLSNREIGATMHLSERTVKNYVSHLLSKLDMHRRTEAAVLAARISERRAQRVARQQPGDG
jgi:DNA-binding NarL/FixJ family response regulator